MYYRSSKEGVPSKGWGQGRQFLEPAGSGWDLQEGPKDLAGKRMKVVIQMGRRAQAKEGASDRKELGRSRDFRSAWRRREIGQIRGLRAKLSVLRNAHLVL